MKTSVIQQTKTAHPTQTAQLRGGGFLLLFFLLGVGWLLAPLNSKAQSGPNGTVPPPPPPPTILVGPVDEVGALLQSSGVLTASPGSLVVAGVFISTTAETRIDERVGPLQAGAWVRVEGDNTADTADALVARRIKVVPPMPYIKVVGTLDQLTTTAVIIDGISLNRTVTTVVIGDPVAGQDRVSARAAIESTGDLLALHVIKNAPTDDGGDDEEEPNKTKLISVIQQMPAQGVVGEWLVGGIPVKVTAETQIHQRKGPLAPGAWVKIIGQVDAEGVLVAERLQTTHTRIFHRLVGVLDQLNPLEVVVDGITLDRSEASTVVGNPQAGKPVVVRGLPDANGLIIAVVIENRGRNEGNKPGLVVKFVGPVNALPVNGLYGEWTIAGRKVNVPVGAYIDEHKGAAKVGAQVKVTALLALNGALTAVEIVVETPGNGGGGGGGKECEFVEFTGTVESLPAGGDLLGAWVVGGKTVVVTEGTRIKSGSSGRGGGHDVQTEEPISVTIGSVVKVHGFVLDDGSIRAKKIEVISNQEHEIVHVGIIKQLPANGLIGNWKVGDRLVQVTNATALQSSDGSFFDPSKEPVRFAVGKLVRVNGTEQNDGSILAAKVKLLQ